MLVLLLGFLAPTIIVCIRPAIPDYMQNARGVLHIRYRPDFYPQSMIHRDAMGWPLSAPVLVADRIPAICEELYDHVKLEGYDLKSFIKVIDLALAPDDPNEAWVFRCAVDKRMLGIAYGIFVRDLDVRAAFLQRAIERMQPAAMWKVFCPIGLRTSSLSDSCRLSSVVSSRSSANVRQWLDAVKDTLQFDDNTHHVASHN